MKDYSKQRRHQAHYNKKPKISSSYKFKSKTIILTITLVILIVAFIFSTANRKDSPTIFTKQQTIVKQKDISEKTTAPTSGDIKNKINRKDKKTTLNTNAKQDTTEDENNLEAKQQKQPLQFDFYDTLTKKSIKVDVEPNNIKQYNYTYMLQVGSFQNSSDANSTRAKLILVGLKPTVSKVGRWYRVDVGPVYSKRDGDVIKHKVQAAGISGSYLRLIDKKEVKINKVKNKETIS